MYLRDLPPLAALKAFSAFAETGNLTNAGAALNVSHAAISQHIRGLESHLGITLVDRTGRALRLTEDGQALATALHNGFGEIAREVERLTDTGANRPLQVTTTPYFAAGWLLPRLADFRANNPGLNLLLDATASVVPLGPGGFDLAVRYGTGNWPGIEKTLLIASNVVILGVPELLGDRDIRGPHDLIDYPWLQELGTSEATTWLRDHGVEDELRGGVTEMPGNLVLEAVRRGDGITATARAFLEPEISAGRLKVLFEDDVEGAGYYLCHKPGVLRPPARRFAGWIQREAKRSYPV